MLYSDREINRLIRSLYPDPYWKTFLKNLTRKIRQEGLFGILIKKQKVESEEEEVNKCYKVSVEQFMKDFLKLFPQETLTEIGVAEEIYEEIKLPKRSTSGSAGYDFFSPIDFKLEPEESIVIPTGIKCQIEPNWFLGLFPRSGLGFKYNVTLSNTIGVIDSDYYNCKDNEGHIMVKIINGKEKPMEIKKGGAFIQGILLPHGLMDDDDATEIREGGMGSTDKK